MRRRQQQQQQKQQQQQQSSDTVYSCSRSSIIRSRKILEVLWCMIILSILSCMDRIRFVTAIINDEDIRITSEIRPAGNNNNDNNYQSSTATHNHLLLLNNNIVSTDHQQQQKEQQYQYINLILQQQSQQQQRRLSSEIQQQQQPEFRQIQEMQHIQDLNSLPMPDIQQIQDDMNHPYRKSGPIIQPIISMKFYTNHSYYHDIIPEGTKLLTPAEIQQVNNEYPDLIAIIHIGPMKTGSSAIQTSFKHMFHRNNQPFYDSNNYISVTQYMNKYYYNSRLVVGNLVGCFRDPRAEIYDFMICQPEMLPKVQEISYIHHYNVIISAEFLTSPDTNIGALKEYLLPWKHHRIIAYYRRYYDWMNSFHNQAAKKVITPYRQKLTDYLYKESNIQLWWNRMYLISSIERWKIYFHDIHIINIYDSIDGDVRDSFYCNGLINATKVCNDFRKKKAEALANPTTTIKQQTANPSVALIYEDLAYYAKELNLWSETTSSSTKSTNGILTVKDVSYKIKYYQEKILNLTRFDYGIAKECPTPEVSNYFLKQTLDTEKLLFPKWFIEHGEEQIRTEFAIHIQTKLCHINPITVLKQDNMNGTIWNYFFKVILPTM